MPRSMRRNRRSRASKPKVSIKVPRAPVSLAGEKRLIRALIKKTEQKKEINFENLASTMHTATPSNSIVVYPLDSIVQGDELSEREGSSIRMSWAHFRFCTSNSDTRSKRLRVMAFQEKTSGGFDQVTGGGTPTYPNLYTTSQFADAGVTGLSRDLVRPINQDYMHVIFDRTYLVRPKTETANVVRGKIRVNRRVDYDLDTAGNVMVGGRIYLVFALIECDQTVGSAAAATVLTSFIRIFFKDASSFKRRN